MDRLDGHSDDANDLVGVAVDKVTADLPAHKNGVVLGGALAAGFDG